jgi:hypothetical protein
MLKVCCCFLIVFVNLTEATVIWKGKLHLKWASMGWHAGKSMRVFSWLIINMGQLSPLWMVLLMGKWFWVSLDEWGIWGEGEEDKQEGGRGRGEEEGGGGGIGGKEKQKEKEKEKEKRSSSWMNIGMQSNTRYSSMAPIIPVSRFLHWLPALSGCKH